MLDSSGELAGIVATPLSVGGYELPVVIPAAAVSSAISSSLEKAPSISRQPASGSAASAEGCSFLLPSPERQRWHQRTQQAQQQWQEGAAQLQLGACAAAAAPSPLMDPSPALRRACQHVGLLEAILGVVACSLSNGQWASGVLVNRYAG